MQKVIWYGAGNGSMDDPFVLTNTSSFTDEQPFSILVQHGTTIDSPSYIWIRFTNYQTNKVFKLALLYADMSPLAPFKERDAGKYTCFNGNNNLGVLDGPYMLVEYGSKDYITKQQMFSRSDLTTVYINEMLEHKFVRAVESTDAIESHLSEDPSGRVLRVDLKIGERNAAVEVDDDGIVVSERTLDAINGALISTPGNITRNNIMNLLNSELDAHNIRFSGSGTNYLTDKTEVESAIKELDTRVKINADYDDSKFTDYVFTADGILLDGLNRANNVDLQYVRDTFHPEDVITVSNIKIGHNMRLRVNRPGGGYTEYGVATIIGYNEDETEIETIVKKFSGSLLNSQSQFLSIGTIIKHPDYPNNIYVNTIAGHFSLSNFESALTENVIRRLANHSDLESKYNFVDFFEGMGNFNINKDCNERTIYINITNLGVGTYPSDYSSGGFLIQTREGGGDERAAQTLFDPYSGKIYTRKVTGSDYHTGDPVWSIWKDHYDETKYGFVRFSDGMGDFDIDKDCEYDTIYLDMQSGVYGTYPDGYGNAGFLIQTNTVGGNEYPVQTLFSPLQGKMFTREVLGYDYDTDEPLWGEWKDHYGERNTFEPDEMAYFNYASSIYGAKYSLLASAWERSLVVDLSEISVNSTTSLSRGLAQYPNNGAEGVIIPQGVTSIGNYAFHNNASNNQPLVIPNSVTSIGRNAFYSWSSNSHPLIIPNSVTSIGHSAFAYWSSNSHPLIIPSSVTSINVFAFNWWSSVPYIEMKRSTPPTLAQATAFNNPNPYPIYVPDESVDDYKTATNWVSLASRIFPISALGGSSGGYEPDNITIGLNEENKLEVKGDLEIDGGFL